jgi:uncharacterized membrane protein YtjA (UPF0391 family)
VILFDASPNAARGKPFLGAWGTFRILSGFSRRRGPRARTRSWRVTMLGWALTFLIVALVAAVLGFGGIAGLSIEIAKIIFFVVIVLFLISAVVGLVRGRTTAL